jgi:hypothetical protein
MLNGGLPLHFAPFDWLLVNRSVVIIDIIGLTRYNADACLLKPGHELKAENRLRTGSGMNKQKDQR